MGIAHVLSMPTFHASGIKGNGHGHRFSRIGIRDIYAVRIGSWQNLLVNCANQLPSSPAYLAGEGLAAVEKLCWIVGVAVTVGSAEGIAAPGRFEDAIHKVALIGKVSNTLVSAAAKIMKFYEKHLLLKKSFFKS